MTNTNPQNNPLQSESFYALPGRDSVYRETGSDGRTKYLEKVGDDAINFRLSIPASETRREVAVTLRNPVGSVENMNIGIQEGMNTGTQENMNNGNVDLTSQSTIIRTDPTNQEDIAIPTEPQLEPIVDLTSQTMLLRTDPTNMEDLAVPTEPQPEEWQPAPPEMVMPPAMEVSYNVQPETTDPVDAAAASDVETVVSPSDDIEALRPLELVEEPTESPAPEQAADTPAEATERAEPMDATIIETPATPPEPTSWQRTKTRLLDMLGLTGERRRGVEDFLTARETEAADIGRGIKQGWEITQRWWTANVTPRLNDLRRWWNTPTPRSWNTRDVSVHMQDAGDELLYGAVRPEENEDHHTQSHNLQERLLFAIPPEADDVRQTTGPALEAFHNAMTSVQVLVAQKTQRDASGRRDAGADMALGDAYNNSLADCTRFLNQIQTVLRTMEGNNNPGLRQFRQMVLEPRVRYIRDLMSEFQGYKYRNMARSSGAKFTATARLAGTKNVQTQANALLKLCSK